jgi:hypothetical protein
VHIILLGIALLVGVFLGGMVVSWLTIIPNSGITPMIILYSAGSIIALCALGLTIYQATITRKHNELILTPRLIIETANYTALKSNDLFDITIQNNGLGPADITDAYFEFFHDEKTYSYTLSINGIDDYVKRIFIEHPKSDESNADLVHRLLTNITTTQRPYREIHSFAKNELIASQTEKKFLYLRLPTVEDGVQLSDEQKQFMRNAASYALKNTRVVIKYKSLYGKEYSYAEWTNTITK